MSQEHNLRHPAILLIYVTLTAHTGVEVCSPKLLHSLHLRSHQKGREEYQNHQVVFIKVHFLPHGQFWEACPLWRLYLIVEAV